MPGKMGKSNPASHRMSNEKRKARRQASWVRGNERKAARVKKQHEQEQANKALRAAGLPTPHEAKRLARALKRANDPELIRRRLLFDKDPQAYYAERRARGVVDTPPKKKVA